jgi:FkbM family methyltransferase
MIRLRDKLNFYSQLKYFVWRLLSSRSTYNYDLVVKMKNGASIIIRSNSQSKGLTSTDIDVAYELFVTEVYKSPQEINAKDVKRIVYVGGNVGYSCVYWFNTFPNAQIVVFEPHPKHVEKIYKHLKLNHANHRVTVIPSAAGNELGSLFLTDMGGESQITTERNEKNISVSIVDWFEPIGTQEIDILKIDIEGGEYALLSDPRVKEVNFKTLIMEWHDTDSYPDGYGWCMNRLKELKYTVIGDKCPSDHCGILYAFA